MTVSIDPKILNYIRNLLLWIQFESCMKTSDKPLYRDRSDSIKNVPPSCLPVSKHDFVSHKLNDLGSSKSYESG